MTTSSALVDAAPPPILATTWPAEDLPGVMDRLVDEHPDTTVLWLRGDACREPSGFWAQLSVQLETPSWFGNNWDALDEVLRAQGWLPGHLVVVTDAHLLLVDAEDRELRLFVEFAVECNDANLGDSAGATDGGFHVLLQTGQAQIDGMVRRFEAAGSKPEVLAGLG